MNIKNILVWLIIVAVAVVGILYDVRSKKTFVAGNQILTQNDVMRAFESKNLVLVPDTESYPYELNKTKALNFKTGNDIIHIYIFKSVMGSIKAVEERSKNLEHASSIYSKTYIINNVIIIYVPKNPKNNLEGKLQEVMDELTIINAKSQLVSIKDINDAFEQEGLHLENWKGNTYFKLNGVQPKMVNTYDWKFAIYVFNSVGDREKGLDDFHKQTELMNLAYSHIYEIRNVLIFELDKPARGNAYKVQNAIYRLMDR
ncbi:hypothetical protein [Paenibacillus sp. N3.4]|uniref:hypothetical protein n=1 Tax=Paenibacillus sp. N3.4 TaxID=2603222 RepID=UPI0011C80B00|nr:hypothetical protein [Paenibacillus sp. N3.4]TXK85750.1 hypothetical protein FU659_02255 [Paenibacillus sp. N3.4]